MTHRVRDSEGGEAGDAKRYRSESEARRKPGTDKCMVKIDETLNDGIQNGCEACFA